MYWIASGFGMNFYGFFVVALLWVVAYFCWASRINASETRRERVVTTTDQSLTDQTKVRR
jgi:hypothetical protein